MIHKLSLILVLFSILQLAWSQHKGGHLVIVGGGLESNNTSVYSQMIDLAGGAENATFAVIPSASGVATQSWVSFSKILMTYGVKPANIHLIPIAIIDDDSTLTTDESTWASNGSDPGLAAIIRNCSAVWFTGGDQVRTMKTLLFPDGTMTPVLKAVWEVYERGGVIGGSSAGAAIMSKVMIGRGSSFGALSLPITHDPNDPENGALLLTQGLGFFPGGIVDQHFHANGRLGRLAVALMHTPEYRSVAFGVDENTAMIYDSQKQEIKVAGTGGVTILDGSSARLQKVKGESSIENLRVSYLEEGDHYALADRKINPASGKKPIEGDEYYDHEFSFQTGIFTGESVSFRELVTSELMDNKGANKVKHLCFDDSDTGYLISFLKDNVSRAFRNDHLTAHGGYTLAGIRMDIQPVTITIMPKN